MSWLSLLAGDVNIGQYGPDIVDYANDDCLVFKMMHHRWCCQYLLSNFRSIRGSLSREVSLSPDEEVVARERKRSVKFKEREVVSRISESETSDLNGGAEEGDKVLGNEPQDVNHVIRNGGGEVENNITVGNGIPGGAKEDSAVAVNGASDSSGA